jgi:hypothetical protein
MFVPMMLIYTAIAVLVLVAGLDDRAARRRRMMADRPTWHLLLDAVLWLPVIVAAMVEVALDAAAALRR